MKVLNRMQIKQAEENAVQNGIFSYCDLMCKAGSAAARIIAAQYQVANKRIAVVCGNGNNGGDGFVIARELSNAGAVVKVVLPMGPPRTETAKENFNFPSDVEIAPALPEDCDFIIDAIFGIGLDRGVTGEIGELIERINWSQAVKIAVDLPSGVLCDGGVPGKAVRADMTVTFIALKPCFLLPPASEYCGEVFVADIGAPPVSYEYLTIEAPQFEKRAKNAHKGTFGTALLIAGSYGMCGAQILAARAALRSGVGIVKTIVCDKNYAAFCAAVPEAVTLPMPTSNEGGAIIKDELLAQSLLSSDAVMIGCGLGQSFEAKHMVFYALQNAKIPIVLDADGINAVSSDINILRKLKAPVIITPHPGEMARLCGTSVAEVEADRAGCARNFAVENSCIVVLKGANTVVAAPDGRVFFNTTGNPGMATGGSGDILSGMMVSLLAQGQSPLKAALNAVYLHGRAGDLAVARQSQSSLLPSDIIEELKML